MRSFFRENTSACSENKWMSLPWPTSGAENIRISMKSSTGDPGRPPGTTMVFATSIYHPFSRKKVFSFLRDEKCRSEVCTILNFESMVVRKNEHKSIDMAKSKRHKDHYWIPCEN